MHERYLDNISMLWFSAKPTCVVTLQPLIAASESRVSGSGVWSAGFSIYPSSIKLNLQKVFLSELCYLNKILAYLSP